ncbi:hypothetical protein VRC34_14820 [Pseudomonas poae]
MSSVLLLRSFFLAVLFIKEQLKEPAALFWIVLSPVVTFYLMSYARKPQATALDYLSSTSWFYAFVASSVALFGLAFYIVGRERKWVFAIFCLYEAGESYLSCWAVLGLFTYGGHVLLRFLYADSELFGCYGVFRVHCSGD